ncbi:MAG: hypothetical protein AAB567_02845 [Patescibacteria group bacterium]
MKEQFSHEGEGPKESQEENPERKIEASDLMSWEEFAEKYPNQQPPPEDARYTVEGAGEYQGKSVVYFGARHVNDPADPMFEEIEDAFQKAQPTKVFVEGMHNLQAEEQKAETLAELKRMGREEVIREYGEPWFIAKLAAEQGIDVESPEPDLGEEISHLLEQGFSKDHLFAFYFYRQILDFHRTGREPKMEAFEEYIASHIEGFQGATNWEDFDYSVEHAVQIGKEMWNTNLNLEDREFYEGRVAPVPSEDLKDNQTTINEIARQSNSFRDVHMVNQIGEALKENDRIFIVEGNAHAVRQRRALETLLGVSRKE